MNFFTSLLNPKKRRAERQAIRHAFWLAENGPEEYRALKARNERMRRIVEHYAGAGIPDERLREPLAYLAGMIDPEPWTVFPYLFTGKYDSSDVEVLTDPDGGFPYVMHGGRRLYYKQDMGAQEVQRLYNSVVLEQDPASPHRYLTPGFDIPRGAYLFDLGAAEADFTLGAIDSVAHAWVFEALPQWEEPLGRTFAPWRDKVTVIPKFAGRENAGDTVSVDSIALGLPKGSTIVLKMDVEGAEADVLAGAQGVLTSPDYDVRAVVCTYHRPDDHRELTALMQGLGYRTESSGYMLFFGADEPPYFRHGLIRCRR